MAATVFKEAKPTSQQLPLEVEFAKCECCGLTEECTPAYIVRVRERHGGQWICGLCAEAVKDETCRSKKDVLGIDEAVKRHMKFCQQFRSSTPPTKSTEDLISAVKHLLRRSLDSPRKKVYPSSSSSPSSLFQ